jgi:6,7-dimethyl-8-ribityllumazine synthase
MKQGAPDLTKVPGAGRLTVAVLASQWHTRVMDGLLDGARRALNENDVSRVTELRVSGAFELTVAAARVANSGVDAIVALGVVIRGDTPHFDFVCQAATTGLTLVAQRTGVPIGFGLLTCDNEDQAIERAGGAGSTEDKGFEATVAALAAAVVLSPYPRG